jgi:hypothetical protein
MEDPKTPAADTDPPISLCPHCQCKVDNEVTQCPECGGYFPALRHRQGRVGWGAICGIARGLFIAAIMITLIAIVNLSDPPFHPVKLLYIAVGVIAILVFKRLSRRCLEKAYRYER